MISIEEMEALLNEIAEALPDEFYKYLNGGIVLLPEEKPNKQADNLYILGQYHRDVHLGRFITIYYGSFCRVYGYYPKDQIKEKLKETLLHEFRHHLESLAGEKDLEIEDANKILEYINRQSGQSF